MPRLGTVMNRMERILGRRDFEVGIIGGGNRPLHVRLARADPNLAHEHVIELEGVFALDGKCVRPAGRHGIEHDLP